MLSISKHFVRQNSLNSCYKVSCVHCRSGVYDYVRMMRNCCIPGCTSSRLKKYVKHGVRFFQIPTGNIDQDWRNRLVECISKYRCLNATEIQRIKEGKMYIRSTHFAEKDVYVTGKYFVMSSLHGPIDWIQFVLICWLIRIELCISL